MKVKINTKESLRMAEIYGLNRNWYNKYGIRPIHYLMDFIIFDVEEEHLYFLAALKDALDYEVMKEEEYLKSLKEYLEHD